MIELKEHLGLLNNALAQLRPLLSEKETYILDQRLLSDSALTLQDIGSEWGVTREAVRQMEARLLAKIKDATMDKDIGSKQEPNNMEKMEDKMMADQNAKYSSYVNGKLTKDTDKKRVLFFFANWCPTCAEADKDLMSNLSKVPEDVKIIKVNYSDTETTQSQKDLATKYGITYQHTFVQIDANGNEVTRWNGGGADALLAKLK
jgi:thiol-disulfide isomerase/thioredoxin